MRYEIWTTPSTGSEFSNPAHVLEAERFVHASGVYYFYDAPGNVIHCIIAQPGMLVRSAPPV